MLIMQTSPDILLLWFLKIYIYTYFYRFWIWNMKFIEPHAAYQHACTLFLDFHQFPLKKRTFFDYHWANFVFSLICAEQTLNALISRCSSCQCVLNSSAMSEEKRHWDRRQKMKRHWWDRRQKMKGKIWHQFKSWQNPFNSRVCDL